MIRDANHAQKTAITAPHKPVVIVAGPGTGKTKTLTARIVYLTQQGAPAYSILALTFTNKAAREMSERLQKSLNATDGPTIATFHALCLAILRDEQAQDVRFATDAERTRAVKTALAQTGDKGLNARQAMLVVSRAKGCVVVPVEDEPLVREYNTVLHAEGLIDFDDLIRDTFALLQNNGAARARQQARYQHILIDEFQDTSELQWKLVQLLRGSDSVFVIGDPKQSIYGFRGLAKDMFEVFRADFPECIEVTLDINYRSRPEIVLLANAIFPGDTPLNSHHSASGAVCLMQTLNEYSEADAALDIIEQGVGGTTMLNATSESGGRHFRDFAVVYRTHRAAKILQQRLHDSGIPYQVVGEGSPYEKPEIQAMISALRWLHTRADAPVAPGLTPQQTRAFLQDASVEGPVSHIAQAVATKLNLIADDPKKKARVDQCIGTLVRFDAHRHSLATCVDYLESIAQQEFYDPQADAVTLLTIHAAKGLEFTSVIVLAAEEGLLPHIRKSEAPNIDEERRLFYVATTRAKQDLTIMYTKKRHGEPSKVSRFAAAITEQLLPRVTDPLMSKTEKRIAKRQQKARQATLF